MTRAFLKQARAQAATTAYRDALNLVRKLPPRDVERALLEWIAEKRKVLDDYRVQKNKESWDRENADYERANQHLMEGEDL